MKKLISLILPVCFLFQITLMAQDNSPQLTLEDLIPGGKNFYKYRIAYPRQIQWAGDTPIYVKGDSIMSISLQEKGSEKLIFDKIALNEVIPDNEKIRSLGVVSFPYISKTIARIQNNYNTYLYDYNSHTLISSYKLPSNAHNIDFSETNEHVAYTSENNLYVMNSKGKVTTVTTDTDSEIVNGQAVHRNEFGINKGTFWSPKGNFLAFYRMDETMVTDYPLVDVSTRIAELKNTKYPMAGMKSHQVTVGIFDPETDKTIFLKTGSPKEKYLTNLAWGPDESSIYIAELNRGQDTCSLVKYNITSGKKELILFTETHPKYVEPENPILFLPNAKESFLWQSKRDGHNHLYIYNTSGKLKKQLTTGDWDVLNILGFDENAKNIFITSTEESPIEKHIYKVNISNGARTRITDEEGVHQAILSRSGKYIIDIYSSQYNPGKIVLREISSNKKKTFFTAKNPYKKINLPEIQLGKIKASDQKTDLYFRLIKPINFNPDKKYPVIVYVYGGPHSQLVDNSWLAQARGWDIFMAEKGYVVFTLDNRGTNNRGLDFENVTHRQLGVTETEDQMMGIEFLKSCTFVDTDRIGVHGWSFGGFMTLNLVLRHPETFKVGVAGGPVTDWKYYEIMYGERYMDTPKENKEGYLNTSMVERAGDLKGRLMLIHGDEDPTVVMQHSLQFLKSAIQKGTHPDFFVYPGHGHNMIGKDRVHLHEHITRYFEDFL